MKDKNSLASDIQVTLDHIDDARRHFTGLALEIENPEYRDHLLKGLHDLLCAEGQLELSLRACTS